jgi:hypothetical protein
MYFSVQIHRLIHSLHKEESLLWTQQMLHYSWNSQNFTEHNSSLPYRIWGSESSSIFWDITPCSLLKDNISEEPSGSRIQATCFALVSCLVYFTTLKIEEACSSETLADFQRLHSVTFQKTELFKSLSCSLKPTTSSYPEPDQSINQLILPNLFLQNPF